MRRPFAVVLFIAIAIACGVLAQEPAARDARVAEAVGMVDADRGTRGVDEEERQGTAAMSSTDLRHESAAPHKGAARGLGE